MPRDERTGLHEEGAQRMLEGGDGTVGVGEGGLEMGEDLRGRPARGFSAGGNSGGGQRPHRAVRILLWPRSNRFQMRCQVRSLRWQSTARMAARMPPATARWRNRHRARGGQAEPSDLVGEPDAEGPPAAAACVAVAAKDPPGADRLSLGSRLSSKPRKKPWRSKGDVETGVKQTVGIISSLVISASM